MHWPRTRKWKFTWVYCFQFRIIAWRCKGWLPASVPMNVLITESLSKLVGNIWRVEVGREKGQMEKIYYVHLWWWRWAIWVVYIYHNEGGLTGWQWKSVEGKGVDVWDVSILKEEDTLQKPLLHLCLSGESWVCVLVEVEYLQKEWVRNAPSQVAVQLTLQHLAPTLVGGNPSAKLLPIISSFVWKKLMVSWRLEEELGVENLWEH